MSYATAPRGESHYAHKLTFDDVRLIRAAGDERRRLIEEARKLSNAALAEKFGLHPSTVDQIINRRKWACT